MFLIDWFTSLLQWLGFIASTSGTILIVGLDNAGKTTLLSKLETGSTVCPAPTVNANKTKVKIGKATVCLIDLGGQYAQRRLWKDYFYSDIAAIIFVVDAADESRFLEAKHELQPLFLDESLTNVPILILGNKIDKGSKAVSEVYLREKLGLQESFTDQSRKIHVSMVSIIKNANLDSAMQWLASVL